jgi:hypothetical protein
MSLSCHRPVAAVLVLCLLPGASLGQQAGGAAALPEGTPILPARTPGERQT